MQAVFLVEPLVSNSLPHGCFYFVRFHPDPTFPSFRPLNFLNFALYYPHCIPQSTSMVQCAPPPYLASLGSALLLLAPLPLPDAHPLPHWPGQVSALSDPFPYLKPNSSFEAPD
jgi:hypothetical protein